jgi:hypothetical protein
MIQKRLGRPSPLPKDFLDYLKKIKNRGAFQKNLFVIVNIKSFWWYKWLPNKKGVRAMTLGNVVLLGKSILPNDLDMNLSM